MEKLLLFMILISLSTHLAEGYKNVVLLMADDMRPQANAFRNTWGWDHNPSPELQTPNIDNLGAMGTTFLKAYCQYPICGPSRTSMMTGRRPDTTKVYANNDYWRDTTNIASLPEYLKGKGFTTLGMGKIYHGDYDGIGLYDEISWSTQYPFQYPGNATWFNSQYDEAVGGLDETYINSHTHKGYPRAFMDRETADTAVEYLNKFADGTENPFFMAVGFKLPHLPWLVPSDVFDSVDGDLPLNCSEPTDLPSIAWYDSNELRGYADIASSYLGSQAEPCLDDVTTTRLRKGYYAAVKYVDALIGDVVQAINNSDHLRENTAIIFTSDHGYSLGEHKMWNKNTNFEINNHVPLIIYDPDYTGGRTTEALVELVDIYPTVLDLAGVAQVPRCNSNRTKSAETPDCREGSSLVDLLDESTKDNWSKDAVFFQVKPGRKMGSTVLTNTYRYTMYNKMDTTTKEINWNRVFDRELYDHTSDFFEMTNVQGDSHYSTVRNTLEAILVDENWYNHMGLSSDNGASP